ncbi:alpha/beta hydrolase family protein [Paenibacillus chartarius]|uniref:Alpha/beta hydrolase family protein n=1 Tax=Paenibacillus chartarius TaxID=747481 RepID=A0ABV6DQW4_9BACL
MMIETPVERARQQHVTVSRIVWFVVVAAAVTAVWLFTGHIGMAGAALGLLPAWAGMAGLLWITHGWRRRRGGRARTGSYAAGAAAGIVLGSVFPVLLPVFELPQPSGPYAVGTTERWIVTGREETFTADSADRRSLLVRFWYPARTEGISDIIPEPYPQEMRRALFASTGLPSWLFGHWDRVRTHAVRALPLSGGEQRYPVLVFSHGASASRFQSLFQVEELASHGYIVAAVQHTYMASETVLPDGRIAPYHGGPDMPSNEEGAELVRVRAADVTSVLDELERWNRQDPLGFWNGRLDLERAGVLGHSDGGSTAVEALALDRRLRAGLDMDGTVYGQVLQQELTQPVMFLMASGTWDGLKQQVGRGSRQDGPEWRYFADFLGHIEQVYSRARADAYRVIVPGTHHLSFSDAALFSPLLALERSASDVHADINRYALAFFNRYLKDQPSSLLEAADPKRQDIRFEARIQP